MAKKHSFQQFPIFLPRKNLKSPLIFLSEVVVKCSGPDNKKLKDISSLFSLKDEVTPNIWLPIHDGAGTPVGSITRRFSELAFMQWPVSLSPFPYRTMFN